MGNRHLNYWWHRSRWPSLVIPLIIFLCLATFSAFRLRENNLQMLKLREAVFVADEKNQDVNQALLNLQSYAVSHMNTRLPKLGDEKAIQLKYTYERLVAAETEKVSAQRAQIARDATAYCEAALPSVRLTERAKCVEDYIAARPVTTKEIPKELYSFDFVSPTWSPDAAGWSLVAAVVAGIYLVIRILSGIFIKRSLRSHI